MTILHAREALLRAARAVIAGATVLTAVHGAAADDAGVHAFFTSLSPGGAGRPAAAAAAVDVSDRSPVERHPRMARARPLTVHLHQPRIVVAQGPTKLVTMSILEDRTLRAGDAVTTARGPASSPVRPRGSTRRAISSASTARHLRRGTSKVLARLDRLPRG